MQLKLYTTQGCHLCELALALIHQAGEQFAFSLIEIEIADSDELTECYGIRIPVLRFEDNFELAWPFTLADIQQHLMA